MIPGRPIPIEQPQDLPPVRARSRVDRRIRATLRPLGIDLHWNPTGVLAGGILVAATIGGQLAGWVGVLVAALLIIAGSIALDRAALVRRRRLDEQQLPHIALLLGRAVRAGQPLEAALADVVMQLREPPDWLLRTSRQIIGGRPLADALDARSVRSRSDAEHLLLSALSISSAHGGDIATSLDLVGDGLRSDIELDARRRVILTQAQMSTTVLVLLPLAFAIVLSVLRGGVVYRGWVGAALAAVGLLLDVVGVRWMRRLLRRLR